MIKTASNRIITLLLCFLIFACMDKPKQSSNETSAIDYAITQSKQILLTSEQGDKISAQSNVTFKTGEARGTIIDIRPDIVKQTMLGVGSSFTESSAFVLAHLEDEKRQEVMNKIFSESGANFALARTMVGASDFSVKGKYSYAPVADDKNLEKFSVAADSEGFSKVEFPNIQDETYDLLPMLKQAFAIKQAQKDKDLRIIASAWTAPPWMKDIEDWFIPGTAENGHQGTGGELKPHYIATYADYLLKYLDVYQQQGIEIWGMTPINEPHGNSGQWESMHFTPQSQKTFIRDHLGPKLKSSQHADVKLLIYDQNRDGLEHWADEILGDEETAPYVYGTAVHWYESTFKVYEEELEKVNAKYPQFDIIHTEGTIDDLGKPAPQGITDPVLFQESGWFNNDSFWWNDNATDWAYTATWAPNPEDHPIYTPVHRYARNIIVSFNHWMTGWIDWNIVLDHNGGPNHVGNFCGAPIMIDTNTGQIYYTPLYYVLSQFSQTIRPGDKAVQANITLAELQDDDIHASATINDDKLLSVQLLNTTKQAIHYQLQIGAQYAEIELAPNAVQTVRVQLQ